MGPERLELIAQDILEQAAVLRGIKGKEYAPDDRLANFRGRAKMLGCVPEELILADMSKHIHRLITAVHKENGEWAWKTSSGEGLKQKVADAINYLLLLSAAMEEKEDRCHEGW